MKQKRCSQKPAETNLSSPRSEEMPVPPVYTPGRAAPLKGTSQSSVAASPGAAPPAPAWLTASGQWAGTSWGARTEDFLCTRHKAALVLQLSDFWSQISRKCPLLDNLLWVWHLSFASPPIQWPCVHRHRSYPVWWLQKNSPTDFISLPLLHYGYSHVLRSPVKLCCQICLPAGLPMHTHWQTRLWHSAASPALPVSRSKPHWQNAQMPAEESWELIVLSPVSKFL